MGSVGAVLSRDRHSGAVHVRETPEGMAAERAGLYPGDRIKMIDGVLVDDMTTAQVKTKLRGPVGSQVRLTVIRGNQVHHLRLTRQPIRTANPVPEREETIEP